MKRLGFFVLTAACASQPAPTVVEIAQPLPPVVVAQTPAPPIAQVAITEPLEIEGLRDPRRFQRSALILATEVVQLNQLLAGTSQSSPDRPTLLLRLAENYVALRKDHKPGAAAQAIATYKRIIDEYPNYDRADEASYFLGLEYELGGDLRNARRTQYELLKNHPTSRYVPYAYFAFGEMFLNEAHDDPSKLPLATQSYEEVLKTTSPLHNLSACRLAHILVLQNDVPGAHALEQRFGITCGL